MTLDEAKRIVGAYQTRTASRVREYMRYVPQVVAKAGGLQMTAAMRGFLAAARRPKTPVGPT